MRTITVAAAPDCGRCGGGGLVRPADGGGGWEYCPACRGSRKAKLLPPFSVDWLLGDDEAGTLVAVEPLDHDVAERDVAVARALMHSRGMGPDYAGGRVVVSDANGVRTFEVTCPGKAVAS
jgi:hypothetical protein